MSFKNPEYLFFLLLLVPIIYWYLRELHKSDASLQISSHRNLDTLPKSNKIKLLHVPFVLRTLAIILIVIVLARPQAANSWRTEKTEGIDIMMAFDVSGSMLAEDFKPNRLEATKSVATEFILSRPNDNMGLVLFAGESFTQCPLTTDHAVLTRLFSAVKYGDIEDGTAIGLGLANSINRIKESETKSKVIILMTDGSNNRGDIAPITAAEIAKTFGIRIYAIGVGSYGQVRVPVQTPIGMQYQMMESDFDEELLKNIADMTGGKYFRATDNNKLRAIYQEIDQLEKTRIDVKEFSKKSEEYSIFALIAFILILLEMLIRYAVLRKIP